MLSLKKISKIYTTDELKQTALDKVSINFRDNEFVSILGPSGSGKTTLLNIIGGLDHYDSGDLIINGISTKKYKDRDWDSYRNHRVGFVFQSYNLISHQSILKNVELALTLSGVSKKERVRRAKTVLKDVGLIKHIHKKPNQLSGGQMQRVAIARALVNDPDILLADEPTGALDSKTSEQIMQLLKDVAKNKLVIMVTHNPDIAVTYSTRIIKIKDGSIIDDNNPYMDEEEKIKTKKKSKKTSMNLLTALSLSFNNLLTKKGRTFLTAFAGSIGIIGIALILSLSSGVQEYIDKTERETLSSYPITIEKTSYDLESAMKGSFHEEKKVTCKKNKICTTDDITNSASVAFSSIQSINNLKDFKKVIDDNYKKINDYVTDIEYSYDLDLQIYNPDTENGITKINPNTFSIGEDTSINNMYLNMNATDKYPNVFNELISNDDLINGQYKVLSGKMPSSFNEMVLVVDKKNQLPASVMYSLDIENRNDIKDIVSKAKEGEKVSLDSINYDYKNLVGTEFKLVINTDYFVKEKNIWLSKEENTEYMKDLIDKSLDIKIVGVVKVADDAVEATSGFVGYRHDLVTYVIDKINNSEIVKEQKDNKDIDIFTGLSFDNISTSYENNLSILSVNDEDDPSTINIYPNDYDSKEKIENIIKSYNKGKNKEDKIVYTDYVGILMNSVTNVINVITYVLIAFVAISLVVSSIMISIITYISVLERTKEIGILRAIGASKKDISRVFNAETIIEGFVAGLLGVVTTIILNIPINIIVNNLTGVNGISHLPLYSGIVLIIISVLLTVFAGLLPSKMASKKDPVIALRTE